MVENKSKKSKVDQGDDSDHIDGELVLTIEKLQELQDELEKIDEEASEKVVEVDRKYDEIRKPVYDRRNEIIKTIPDFWLTAFLSHPALGDLLTEEDQKVFKYLDSLDIEDFKNMKLGYSISFNFKENPYFEDTKLIKTFAFFEEDGTTKTTGTSIKWKEGMGIANGVNHETKGNKRSHAEESFFSWFGENEEKKLVEFADEVGEIIKEDLWPNPLKYFNNDADEEDSDGEDVDEENRDDEDEDEDDDSGEDNKEDN